MLDLIINAICAVARPSALLREAAERQEIVIKLLKQFNLDPEHPPADFTGVYQYALVEYGVGKPKQILELFRQNEIRQAFRQAYDRNQPSILVREVEEFLRSYALGNEIRNLGIDSRRELAAFAVIFDEIAKRTRNPAEVRRDRQIENLQRRLAAIQSTLNRLPTVEGIRTEIARLASQTYPPLTAAENPSQTFALAQQMRGWFETLKYHFETYEIATDTYFEWIINIPARRGCDRILVRGIIGEIGINDLETLRQTVATQRTDEGWLVTSRRISRAARNATETIENRHLFCYTFDELLDEQADFSRYFQWLEKEVKQRKIDQLYVPLACTKAEIDPQTKQKIAVSRYEEEDGWIDGYIDLWLDDPVKEHLSILGEFGTGKTWFAFHYAWTSLQKYLQAKKRGRQRPRIPIIIPLRDYATAVTVESLFSEFFFRKHEIRLPGYSVFQQLNSMGKLLLIFDGFDEMADKIDRQKMANNFWELASAITPGAKAILTCRTEHFPEAKQGRALLNAEIPASTSALTGEPPQFEILELEPFNDEQIRQVLSFSAQPETVAKVINNPQLLDLARRPVMIDLILEALPEIEAGKPIDIARIYLYAVHRKMARDITTKRTFTSLADKLYFLCELSWEMLANEQMSLHYRLFPDRIRRLFGSKVQAETDLDHWHHDMMGQTMLVRDAEGNYKPAHRSLLEFFVAYKFAAELGILAADFAEIADLAYFTSEANLRETFGKAPLTKAVLDLILPMLEPKETTKQRLLKIITATKGKTEDEVGYIGGNAVTLLLKTHPSALENQDFSRTVILGTDFTQANLHNLNFTQANLAKSIFPRIVGSVFSVVFSPDNKLFATAHSQGEVRLWRVSDYQQISVFEGHTGWVERVVFSPDSKTLFSCSSDKTIKVWNLYNGYCLQTLLGHKDTVNSIKISLDGKILASCSNDRTIKLWDLQTGKCFNTFEGHTDKVLELVFSSKNDMIVSCSYDKTIKIWEFFTGECLQTLSGHSDKVRSVTLSADDKIIASSGHDKTIKIWSFSTGECLRTLTGHTDTVNSVIINLDNNVLISSSYDRTVKIWDLNTGDIFKELAGDLKIVRSISLSPDRLTLVSSSDEGTVNFWNILTGERIKTLHGFGSIIRKLDISNNSDNLVSISEQKSIKVWNLFTGKFRRVFTNHTRWLESVIISPDNKVIASSSSDRTVKLWDFQSGELLQTFEEHPKGVASVAITPNNLILASASDDIIKLWSILSGECIKTLRGHTSWISSLDITNNGNILVSGSDDRTIKIWNINTGKCLTTLRGHASWVNSIAVSPDSKIVASGSDDKTIKIWDIETGECVVTFRGHISDILSVAFSPVGKIIASSSADKTIKLWDVATQQCIKTLRGHSGWVRTVVFSPDNTFVASGSFDGTIKLWDLQTGECFKTLDNKPYVGMNITEVKGISDAEKATLKALGAVSDY